MTDSVPEPLINWTRAGAWTAKAGDIAAVVTLLILIFGLVAASPRDVVNLRKETVDSIAILRMEVGDLRMEVVDLRKETTESIATIRNEVADLRKETTKSVATIRNEIADLRKENTENYNRIMEAIRALDREPPVNESPPPPRVHDLLLDADFQAFLAAAIESAVQEHLAAAVAALKDAP